MYTYENIKEEQKMEFDEKVDKILSGFESREEAQAVLETALATLNEDNEEMIDEVEAMNIEEEEITGGSTGSKYKYVTGTMYGRTLQEWSQRVYLVGGKATSIKYQSTDYTRKAGGKAYVFIYNGYVYIKRSNIYVNGTIYATIRCANGTIVRLTWYLR